MCLDSLLATPQLLHQSSLSGCDKSSLYKKLGLGFAYPEELFVHVYFCLPSDKIPGVAIYPTVSCLDGEWDSFACRISPSALKVR